MEFDMGQLDRGSRYKIIGSCITPRPIAWVTTRSTNGIDNVAPFSFFNALGDNPPILVLGMVAHAEVRLKDTPGNIRETGEFVVHVVCESDASAMNLTSIDAPPDVEEGTLASLTLVPSAIVSPRRIVTAPASFECRTMHFLETGPNQVAIVGEVLWAHIRDEFIMDRERLQIDVPAMNLISRLHGPGWYGRQTDVFDMRRPAWSKNA